MTSSRNGPTLQASNGTASGVCPTQEWGGFPVRLRPRMMVAVARGLIGALIVAGEELSAGAAFAQDPGDDEVSCRRREVTVGAAADACLLNTDPFANFGLLDRL